jgi:hypothetical protein
MQNSGAKRLISISGTTQDVQLVGISGIRGGNVWTTKLIILKQIKKKKNCRLLCRHNEFKKGYQPVSTSPNL